VCLVVKYARQQQQQQQQQQQRAPPRPLLVQPGTITIVHSHYAGTQRDFTRLPAAPPLSAQERARLPPAAVHPSLVLPATPTQGDSDDGSVVDDEGWSDEVSLGGVVVGGQVAVRRRLGRMSVSTRGSLSMLLSHFLLQPPSSPYRLSPSLLLPLLSPELSLSLSLSGVLDDVAGTLTLPLYERERGRATLVLADLGQRAVRLLKQAAAAEQEWIGRLTSAGRSFLERLAEPLRCMLPKVGVRYVTLVPTPAVRSTAAMQRLSVDLCDDDKVLLSLVERERHAWEEERGSLLAIVRNLVDIADRARARTRQPSDAA